MSPAMTVLYSYGITQQMLVMGILVLVAAGVIGLYWHIILPGAIIILVGSLFFTAQDVTEVAHRAVNEINNPHHGFDEHKAFMEDCTNVAAYSKEKCEDLWYQRGEAEVQEEVQESSPKVDKVVDKTPESHVQLLDVENEEYKQRRAEALAKPNAVVLHETYH